MRAGEGTRAPHLSLTRRQVTGLLVSGTPTRRTLLDENHERIGADGVRPAPMDGRASGVGSALCADGGL